MRCGFVGDFMPEQRRIRPVKTRPHLQPVLGELMTLYARNNPYASEFTTAAHAWEMRKTLEAFDDLGYVAMRPLWMVEAIVAIRRAIEDPGAHPEYHQQQVAHLRQQWPTLWQAIQQLIGPP